MVFSCKHCGAALRVDDARVPKTTFRVRCHQCQNLLTVEPPKPATADSTAATRPAPPVAPPSAAPPVMQPKPQAAPPPPPAAEEKPKFEPAPAAEAAPPKPGAPADKSHYLQKISLFSSLSYEACAMVEGLMRRREFAPMQTIVKEGGPGDSMFVIHSGAVEVRRRDPSTGIDFLLTELGEGACFGEMALLTGKSRTASIITTEPTVCGMLEKSSFEKLVLANPSMALALSRVIADRLEESNQATGIEFINLSKLQFDARVLGLLPQPMIMQHKVLPVAFATTSLHSTTCAAS